MSMWLAVLLVGLGSYLLRVVPMLLGERVRLPDELDAALRHAAVGAMTGLMVLGALQTAADPFSPAAIAVGLALAVSLAVGLTERPMLLVVLSGGVTYGATLGVLAVLIG
jgi:branched-subunit amino acid transport protein